MGQIQSLDEFIGFLVRRRLLIGAVTVFGIFMTLLYVMSKPDVFSSTALIQVQSPTVANPDAATTNQRDNSAQRLQAIQQRLTTREAMLAVIERHSLYQDLPLSDDQKVHLLRISLRFETVASAATSGFGAPNEVSALLISADAPTRAQAARVANDFAQGVLDAGANNQMNRAREALAFYREEQSKLKAQIDALSAEFAAYQSENRDAVPAQRDLLRTELTAVETELRSLDQALVAARNERDVIERKQVEQVILGQDHVLHLDVDGIQHDSLGGFFLEHAELHELRPDFSAKDHGREPVRIDDVDDAVADGQDVLRLDDEVGKLSEILDGVSPRLSGGSLRFWHAEELAVRVSVARDILTPVLFDERFPNLLVIAFYDVSR